MAEEKNAVLTMKLKAKSGYSSEETHKVSVEQWAAIQLICIDGPARKLSTMAKDGDLLRAAKLAYEIVSHRGLYGGDQNPKGFLDQLGSAIGAYERANTDRGLADEFEDMIRAGDLETAIFSAYQGKEFEKERLLLYRARMALK